jgi:hypothetical protein
MLRKNFVGVKITDEELSRLCQMCEAAGCSRSYAIKAGLRRIWKEYEQHVQKTAKEAVGSE